MERANEKPIELTAKELDAVTGGKLGNGTLPFNPFSPPSVPKKTYGASAGGAQPLPKK